MQHLGTFWVLRVHFMRAMRVRQKTISLVYFFYLLLFVLIFPFRAVKLDPDLGDSWACFYRFELQHGTEVSMFSILYYYSRFWLISSRLDSVYTVAGMLAESPPPICSSPPPFRTPRNHLPNNSNKILKLLAWTKAMRQIFRVYLFSL